MLRCELPVRDEGKRNDALIEGLLLLVCVAGFAPGVLRVSGKPSTRRRRACTLRQALESLSAVRPEFDSAAPIAP